MARPTLLRHRKFLRLSAALGDDAIALGSLELIWSGCYEAGDDYLGDSTAVELAARWRGEPGKLAHALLSADGDDGVGFIEELQDRPGRFRVHDLWQHAPDYVERRLEREIARKEKGVTLSELRAEAGKKGGLRSARKRRDQWKQAVASEKRLLENSSKRVANDATPAPAPALVVQDQNQSQKHVHRAKNARFTTPTIEEVKEYCQARGNNVDPVKFHAHYTSNGWKVGRNPMRNWKASVITWEKNDQERAPGPVDCIGRPLLDKSERP